MGLIMKKNMIKILRKAIIILTIISLCSLICAIIFLILSKIYSYELFVKLWEAFAFVGYIFLILQSAMRIKIHHYNKSKELNEEYKDDIFEDLN